MKKRILSAIVMLAITIPVLIIGKIPFEIFALILSVMSVYEWNKVYKTKKEIPVFIRILTYLLVPIIIFLNVNYNDVPYLLNGNYLLIVLLALTLPIIFVHDNKKYNIEDATYTIIGTLIIIIAFIGFISVRNTGLAYLIYLALVTVMTDTFALVTGMLIGKHKLCKTISPKKTIEGFIGGLIIGTAVPVLMYIYIIDSNIALYILIPITMLLSIIGQLGDLFFSSVKRQYDVKDYSNLIPGHGGILDRLDSLIFVVITYILIIGLL